jgi:hypothetical protein
MAVTVDVKATLRGWAAGSEQAISQVVAEVTFDTSYPTGGEIMLLADYPTLSSIDTVIVGSVDDVNHRCSYITATKGLLLWIEDGTTGIEAQEGSTDDASAVKVIVQVFGKPAAL